jgi:hypothetical protein
MSLHILFAGCTKGTDAKQYIHKKLSAFFDNVKLTPAEIGGLTANLPVPQDHDLPLAPPEFIKADENQLRVIRKETNVFQLLVNKKSPLLEGEQLTEDDGFGYLKEDYGEYTKGTPVLRRQTNFAKIFYLYNLAIIGENGSFKYCTDEAPQPPVKLPLSAGPVGVGLWTAPLKMFAEGLVKGIGGAIGNKLIDCVFPGGTFDYETMMKDFAKIVEEANLNQTISEQGAILNNVITSIHNIYIPKKDNKVPQKELYTYVTSYQKDIGGVVRQLTYKGNKNNYQKAGFDMYIQAMNMQFANFQELALVDYNAKTPEESSYITTIKQTASQECTYAKNIRQEIINDHVNARTNTISAVLNNPYCDGCGSGVACKNRYYFRDTETGYRSKYYEQSGCSDDPSKRCQVDRDKYYNDRKREATKTWENEMAEVLEIIALWEKLKTSPLPHV